ncbi:hypothetical protein ACOMHN_040480 [Nucella lapillus]
MDPSIAKKTQDTLGKVIKKPPLTDKLLGKPPFRFLHDVVTSVIKTTGFMKGLYADSEMSSDNVKEKEAKIAFLQKAIDMVSAVLGQGVSAKPAKIVAGHEPERTNAFLQALAAAIDAKVDNDEYVKRVLSGGGPPKKEKEEKEEKKEKEKDRDRTRSASRRKDDGKQKKEDKEKSHDREKDKRHRDRSGDGHEEKEKDKHRDRREKSRDREDRHRDKDKDRERRKKPMQTSGKSGRMEDREAPHHPTDTAIGEMKGAVSLKPHTDAVVAPNTAKSIKKPEADKMPLRSGSTNKVSRLPKGEGTPGKKPAMLKTSVTSASSSAAFVQPQSAATPKTRPSNPWCYTSPDKPAPVKSSAADKTEKLVTTAGSPSKPSRALEAGVFKSGSRPARQTVASSSSFPTSPDRQDARQRKHRDAPPRQSSPAVIKQSSSPTLEQSAGKTLPRKIPRSAAVGTKHLVVSVPTASSQLPASKHTKKVPASSASRSANKSGTSSVQTPTKSVSKAAASPLQSTGSKKQEAQKTAGGASTKTKTGPSWTRKSSFQLPGNCQTPKPNVATSAVPSTEQDTTLVADRTSKPGPEDENEGKKQGDLFLVGDVSFSEDLSQGRTWSHDSRQLTSTDDPRDDRCDDGVDDHRDDSSPSLSQASPLSCGSQSGAHDLRSPQGALHPLHTNTDINATFILPSKTPTTMVTEVTFLDSLQEKGQVTEDEGQPQERPRLDFKVKASRSCYNLSEENALMGWDAGDEYRQGHKEAEEKENESPEQNGEKESSQDAPSRLQRPTSAKGSRRRRQGREAIDDDDEEFQQRGESHGPSIGENDLPPQITAARKMARPPSARPAPPRPKQDGVEAEPAMRLGTGAPTNVIVDDGKLSDDEDNFLVEESAPPPPAPEPVSAQAEAEDDAEHGALVKKMLESKKEAEQQQQPTKKTEIERPALSDAQRRKQRELVSKEIERLQTSIQSLTRSANPLGKIMDYVQEDMDSMQKELDRWRSENKEHALALRRERNVTDRAIEPLKAQLADLDRAITDQLDLIAASKSNIMRNDRRMEKMLQSIARS